jgi:hypothetical protein
MTAAAIKATFSDWRTVKGRKMLQLVFEVPLEQQGDVLTYLGAPNPSDPQWCGIAMLAAEKPAPVEKAKRTFAELRPSQQAGIRCNDKSFWRFAETVDGYPCITPESAGSFVRKQCGVVTRADLDTDPTGAAKWRKLDDAYVLWTRGIE